MCGRVKLSEITRLSKEQVERINFLLYECEDEQQFSNVLQQVESSEELHSFAEQFNWDCGFDELKAVLDHPLCDRGTALMIYWLGEPLYFAEYNKAGDVPEVNRLAYAFNKEVQSMLLGDRFKRNYIRFDPMKGLNVVRLRQIENQLEIPASLKLANC